MNYFEMYNDIAMNGGRKTLEQMKRAGTPNIKDDQGKCPALLMAASNPNGSAFQTISKIQGLNWEQEDYQGSNVTHYLVTPYVTVETLMKTKKLFPESLFRRINCYRDDAFSNLFVLLRESRNKMTENNLDVMRYMLHHNLHGLITAPAVKTIEQVAKEKTSPKQLKSLEEVFKKLQFKRWFQK